MAYKGKVFCQVCENYVSKFKVKKLYATQSGAIWKKSYYGCACLSCFNRLLNQERKKRNNINFFSDNIRDLNV